VIAVMDAVGRKAISEIFVYLRQYIALTWAGLKAQVNSFISL
jgi:hypothetical protein